MRHLSRSHLVVVPSSAEPYLAAMETAGAIVEGWIEALPEGAEVIRRDVESVGHWEAKAVLYWSEPEA